MPLYALKNTYSGLEERHGGVHHALDSGSVQGLRSEVGERGEGRAHHKERDSLRNTEAGIDAHLEETSERGTTAKVCRLT